MIEKEEAPYEFKIHMFSKSGHESENKPVEEGSAGEEATGNKDEQEMREILAGYDAQNIRS